MTAVLDMVTCLRNPSELFVKSANEVEIMKSSYVPERNVLLTVNEYKILQQTALEASYLILHSFSSISKKDPSIAHGEITTFFDGGLLDSEETAAELKQAWNIKKLHSKYLDSFNNDPKNAMEKLKKDGLIPDNDQ